MCNVIPDATANGNGGRSCCTLCVLLALYGPGTDGNDSNCLITTFVFHLSGYPWVCLGVGVRLWLELTFTGIPPPSTARLSTVRRLN